eukprot:TRINITY_DN50457_c0_g1_i1.p1 TRINITY_DN50457_c0_g1~~TRINITY_DN50457_c0_g1_i1.p1  ORF type:complete len:1047 (-),score=114.20 TRINITY_DN50457_c0_g1_i1:134-3274(-)
MGRGGGINPEIGEKRESEHGTEAVMKLEKSLSDDQEEVLESGVPCVSRNIAHTFIAPTQRPLGTEESTECTKWRVDDVADVSGDGKRKPRTAVLGRPSPVASLLAPAPATAAAALEAAGGQGGASRALMASLLGKQVAAALAAAQQAHAWEQSARGSFDTNSIEKQSLAALKSPPAALLSSTVVASEESPMLAEGPSQSPSQATTKAPIGSQEAFASCRTSQITDGPSSGPSSIVVDVTARAMPANTTLTAQRLGTPASAQIPAKVVPFGEIPPRVSSVRGTARPMQSASGSLALSQSQHPCVTQRRPEKIVPQTSMPLVPSPTSQPLWHGSQPRQIRHGHGFDIENEADVAASAAIVAAAVSAAAAATCVGREQNSPGGIEITPIGRSAGSALSSRTATPEPRRVITQATTHMPSVAALGMCVPGRRNGNSLSTAVSSVPEATITTVHTARLPIRTSATVEDGSQLRSSVLPARFTSARSSVPTTSLAQAQPSQPLASRVTVNGHSHADKNSKLVVGDMAPDSGGTHLRMASPSKKAVVGSVAESFKVGETVQVWSKSSGCWILDGRICDISDGNVIFAGVQVPSGAVRVVSSAGEKWVMPDQLKMHLRRLTAPTVIVEKSASLAEIPAAVAKSTCVGAAVPLLQRRVSTPLMFATGVSDGSTSGDVSHSRMISPLRSNVSDIERGSAQSCTRDVSPLGHRGRALGMSLDSSSAPNISVMPSNHMVFSSMPRLSNPVVVSGSGSISAVAGLGSLGQLPSERSRRASLAKEFQKQLSDGYQSSASAPVLVSDCSAVRLASSSCGSIVVTSSAVSVLPQSAPSPLDPASARCPRRASADSAVPSAVGENRRCRSPMVPIAPTTRRPAPFATERCLGGCSSLGSVGSVTYRPRLSASPVRGSGSINLMPTSHRAGASARGIVRNCGGCSGSCSLVPPSQRASSPIQRSPCGLKSPHAVTGAAGVGAFSTNRGNVTRSPVGGRVLRVLVSEGQWEELRVCRGDNLEKVSAAFVRRHDLRAGLIPGLVGGLRRLAASGQKEGSVDVVDLL